MFLLYFSLHLSISLLISVVIFYGFVFKWVLKEIIFGGYGIKLGIRGEFIIEIYFWEDSSFQWSNKLIAYSRNVITFNQTLLILIKVHGCFETFILLFIVTIIYFEQSNYLNESSNLSFWFNFACKLLQKNYPQHNHNVNDLTHLLVFDCFKIFK